MSLNIKLPFAAKSICLPHSTTCELESVCEGVWFNSVSSLVTTRSSFGFTYVNESNRELFLKIEISCFPSCNITSSPLSWQMRLVSRHNVHFVCVLVLESIGGNGPITLNNGLVVKDMFGIGQRFGL